MLEKLKTFLKPEPLISLLHTTARTPDGWVRAFCDWSDKAENPARIEYVLCVDRGALTLEQIDAFRTRFNGAGHFGSFKIVENTGRPCAVDGWNAAAAASTGKLLVTVSDDLFPPAAWDTGLLTACADLDRQAALEIEAGSGSLMTFSILTRAYYERYGYIFFPEYLGMFGDNDFTETARRDGVVVDAKHLVFTHEHPAYNTAAMDAIYAHQHRREAWAVGKATFKKRFPALYRPILAVCVPGETYRAEWLKDWSVLLTYMASKFHVAPFFAFSSNVHVTRLAMWESMTTRLGPTIPPDLVLWLDDDNTLTPAQFDMLVDDLDRNPDLSMVVGWCWAGKPSADRQNPLVSCGKFDENDLAVHYGYQSLMGFTASDLVPIDFSGFPVVLMRHSAMEAAGPLPFAPRLNSKHPWGFNSEDTSFCLNARDRVPGFLAVCDRRVKVPHYKYGFEEPVGFDAARPPESKNGRSENAA